MTHGKTWQWQKKVSFAVAIISTLKLIKIKVDYYLVAKPTNMRLCLLVFTFMAILSCNGSDSNPTADASGSKEGSAGQASTTASGPVDGQSVIEFDTATSQLGITPIDSFSKKNAAGERKPAYLINMNSSWVLQSWQVHGESVQSTNCPVGKTCDYDDAAKCLKEGKRILIGTVPCGVTYNVTANFRNANGETAVWHIKDGYTRCDQTGVNFPVHK